MDNYIVSREDMVAVAEAIRAKGGTTDALVFPNGWKTAIEATQGSGSTQPLGEKLYSFGVVSDVHINATSNTASRYFDQALTLFESLGADLVCTAGDIADTSTLSELEEYMTICGNHPNLEVHTCRGNHDEKIDDADWERITGRPCNYEVVWNNDVFLFWSILGNRGSSQDSLWEGFDWLKNRLNRYKGSRIFLFLHYPPSGYSGLAPDQYYGFKSSQTLDDELVTALNLIKNVTVFTGHTHYQFDVQDQYDNMNIYRFNAGDVNLVHVPSSSYCRDANFDSTSKSEGWFIEAYEKAVILRGYNLKTGEEVSGTEFILSTDNKEVSANAIILDQLDATLGLGEMMQINVTLADASAATIKVASTNSMVTVSPSTLTFNASNWNVPQAVTVSASNSFVGTFGCMVTFKADGMPERVVSLTLESVLPDPPVIAKRDSWYKGSVAKGTITEINFVDTVSEAPATYTETWDASADGDGSITAYRNGTVVYVAGNGSGRISVTKDADYIFSDYEQTEIDFFTSLKTINGMQMLETSNATDMHSMFYGCESLEAVDLSSFDTSNVTQMNGMFYDCRALKSIDLSSFDTSKVEDMHEFCYHADIANPIVLGSRFTCENVIDMEGMFKHCHEVKSLDLSMFDTTKVENANGMIKYCYALESILTGDGFTFENATDMTDMFNQCYALKSLDLSMMKPTKAEIMVSMFQDCTALEVLNLGANFATPALTNASQMFDHCDVLNTLDIRNFDTRNIASSSTETDSGLYRFARKSGIMNLIVGPNFVQDYNMAEAGSSGMFRTDASTPLTITGANAVLKTYNFSADNRTVTFID